MPTSNASALQATVRERGKEGRREGEGEKERERGKEGGRGGEGEREERRGGEREREGREREGEKERERERGEREGVIYFLIVSVLGSEESEVRSSTLPEDITIN